MKIIDLTLTMIEWTGARVQYGSHNPVLQGSQIGLLTISTDAGVQGQSYLGASYRSAEIEAWSMINVLKPAILGRDPFERGALWKALGNRLNSTSYRAIGAIDVALWDLAGRAAGLAVHKLIGSYRQSVPAYASSATLPSPEAYVEQAIAVKEAGYVGYKTHPPVTISADDNIRLHQKIRDAVGPGFLLMLDAAGHLDYPQAMKIGDALAEMDFHWFEDPLPHTDMWTYVKLCQKLKIMVMATEYAPGGFHFYAPWITSHATDALRGDVAVKGGITPCLMTAHLAHGFHMNYEIHHGGNSVNNIANLQLTMALPNSEMFEVLLPNEAHQFGVVGDLKVGIDGHMRCPEGPGLGVAYDDELIKRHTVAVLS